jgi:hypothetical protein
MTMSIKRLKLTITTVGVLAIAAPATARVQSYALAGPAEIAQSDRDRAREDADRAQEQRDRDREQREREQERKDREKEQRDREREQESNAYDRGREALDSARWDRAVSAFDRVIEMKGSKVDAALYWKAYAQNKLGQRAEALSTIAEVSKSYPKSRYLQDAKALEVEVRRGTSQQVRPEDESDEEMKIYALNALQDREEAIPMLQKILSGASSPRLKERALFVLAQSNSPKAREVLVGIAKGNSTPDLQSKAIQYLGVHGGRESRAALADVYSSTSDVDVKRRILRAFMVAGEKDRLMSAAQGEQNAELRAEAVRQLGVMGAHDELWTLYQKESSLDVKKQILQAMFVGGNAARLIDLAKTEQNAELRRLAVRNLGLIGSKRTGDALVEIYGTEKDPDIKKAAINALFIQNNAESLVAIARKESDQTMRKEIVQKLSLMRSKAATDYLMEILNK